MMQLINIKSDYTKQIMYWPSPAEIFITSGPFTNMD